MVEDQSADEHRLFKLSLSLREAIYYNFANISKSQSSRWWIFNFFFSKATLEDMVDLSKQCLDIYLTYTYRHCEQQWYSMYSSGLKTLYAKGRNSSHYYCAMSKSTGCVFDILSFPFFCVFKFFFVRVVQCLGCD